MKLIDKGMYKEQIRFKIEPETVDLLENEKAVGKLVSKLMHECGRCEKKNINDKGNLQN